MTNKNNQTSLVIKTDENNKAVPLGIKSTVQGIEQFTKDVEAKIEQAFDNRNKNVQTPGQG